MSIKYIFVTGGVVSSLGKGITAASIGRLLKSRGIKVTMQKFDPYINVDPGTMSPYQHGEVFVTEDGAETDLDLGHYERFIDVNLSRNSNITTGKIYWEVITKERQGGFKGSTIQVIPHITNTIKECLTRASKESGSDIVITEIGGTVGDIESLPFLEAIRQMRSDIGRENVLYIHVTLVPYLEKAGELKTKPTQHSVKELRSIGIQPDIIVTRSSKPIPPELKDKIALFCDIDREAVIDNYNVDTIYEVPLILKEQKVDEIIINRLGLEKGTPDLKEWEQMVRKIKNPQGTLKIAIVGKYIQLRDAYLSVAEALSHCGTAEDQKIDIKWVSAEDLEKGESIDKYLSDVHGIVVPGGFGERGIKGKIEAVRYARTNNIPFLGLCLGMQCAIIEFARNVCKLTDAYSTEFKKDLNHPVVHRWKRDNEQKNMRLGSCPCRVKEGTHLYKAYGTDTINERHRHKYEFNNKYRELLTTHGMVISSTSPDNSLVEAVELKDHPWFVGTQFHPEYKSRPNRPHPLFREFIKAALKRRDDQ